MGLTCNTVAPIPGITVDFFVTHTIVEDANYKLREAQARELVQVINKSLADFVVLAGDFNAAPMAEDDQTYSIVNDAMTDAFQEAKLDPTASQCLRTKTFSRF